MGRHAKPIKLHLVNGNTANLSKDEIKTRQEDEESLKSGCKLYHPSAQVKSDPAAWAMFKRLRKLYKGIDHVEGLDEMAINRYCMLSSQATMLEDSLITINGDLDECDEFKDRLALYKVRSSTLTSLNKTRDMLIKLEDRLFLNPISRIKSVPKREKPKQKDPNADMFGD